VTITVLSADRAVTYTSVSATVIQIAGPDAGQ
jgi:hypothetical protein